MTYQRADLLRYYASDVWVRKRRACWDAWDWACAVCGHDWRGVCVLQCHHLPGAYEKLGHEDVYKDLRPLCERHHPKGRYSLFQIKQARSAYRWNKRIRRLSSWLWAGLRALLRAVVRRLLSGRRGRPTAS